MTVSIRYITNTTTAANVNTDVGSNGNDYQLLAVPVTTTAGIAAGASANILTWTGAGTIQAIMSSETRNAGALYDSHSANFTTISVDATGKIIKLAVAANGYAVPAGATIYLLLVIGNY